MMAAWRGLCDRQREADGGALRVGLERKRAAMRLDDRFAQRQSDAEPARPCSRPAAETRSRASCGGKPGPLSATRTSMKSASTAFASISTEPAQAAALADRLDGVAQQIDQDLLDLQQVDHDRRQIGGERRCARRHGACSRSGWQSSSVSSTMRSTLHGARLLRSSRTSARRWRTTSAARSTCATAFFAVSATSADIGIARAHRVVDQPRISAGRHQRLIELVRHRRREFAHAAEPRQTRQLLLLQAQLRLGAAPLGDQFAGDQPGHRQNEHQRLKGGDVEARRPATAECRG